ncbi:hypothetical protein HLB35_15590 [Halomonas sp. TBZ9]|uniref:Uncharacterized protein n=1 Tax=Vreelandella azerica TaxID=2732867 RepID=A0A7Y3XC11_9GAMM|nr:hypothetical protein [Halomonas azerica]NOG32821.1 hypothetical protein [Halomonas azerica]
MDIMANANRHYALEAAGGAIGIVGAGVSVVTVELTGSTRAYIGEDVMIGNASDVGSAGNAGALSSIIDNVSLTASSNDNIDLYALAVGGGIVGALALKLPPHLKIVSTPSLAAVRKYWQAMCC